MAGQPDLRERVLKKLEVNVVVDSVAPALDEQRESLISGYIDRVLRDPHLEILRKISDAEFQGLAGYILTSLRDYVGGDEEALDSCGNFIGNTCFQLSIPLLETCYALYLLDDKVVALLTREGAGEEVLGRSRKFFDRLVLELLRRY